MDADVGVVGVGSIGSLAMWQLACRGVDVIGFEQHSPGHDRGAAGGETRLFRLAAPEGAQYVPLLRHARELWQALEDESGRSLFLQCGGLTIGGPDQREIVDMRANAAAQDVPVDVLSTGEVGERYPQHRLLDGEVGVYDGQAGLLRCDLAVLAAAQAAEARGARIVRYAPVQAVDATADGVEIRTAERTWRVREVVVATGAWSARFLPDPWAALVEPRRIILGWYAAVDASPYLPERFPVFIRVTHDLFLYGGPSVDGTTVKIGGAVPGRAIPDPDTFDRRHTRDELRAQSDVVGTMFDGLHPEPLRVDAFTDLYTPDTHPLLGRVGPDARVIVATGGSGGGFKLAPALAASVADMVAGRSGAPFPFLSPERLR